jgi:hypothetical protein
MAMAGVLTAYMELVHGYPVLTVNLRDADLNTDGAVREVAFVTATSPRCVLCGLVCAHVAFAYVVHNFF